MYPKYGCNGNPSSTNVTNTAPSSTSVVAVMKHANDVNALGRQGMYPKTWMQWQSI